MHKSLHFSLIIALATLTVVSTGTILRDGNGHPLASANAALERTWRAMSSVFMIHPDAATAVGTGDKSADNQSGKAQVQEGIPTAAPAQQAVPGWSADDVNHLTKLATSLASSLSQSDWLRLANDLGATGQPSAQADGDVAKVLSSRISPTDLAWVQTHFQGTQAFNQEDVSLLQQTVTELRQTLTPEERQMVVDGVQQWLQNASR